VRPDEEGAERNDNEKKRALPEVAKASGVRPDEEGAERNNNKKSPAGFRTLRSQTGQIEP